PIVPQPGSFPEKPDVYPGGAGVRGKPFFDFSAAYPAEYFPLAAGDGYAGHRRDDYGDFRPVVSWPWGGGGHGGMGGDDERGEELPANQSLADFYPRRGDFPHRDHFQPVWGQAARRVGFTIKPSKTKKRG